MAASITDNQDGTGITATTSGHTTSVLYVAAPGAGNALSAVATINGSGSASVSLGIGSYVAVWQLDGIFATPTFFRVTEAATGVHMQVLNAIRDLIVAAALPGYPSDQAKHKIHKRPVRTMSEFGDPPFGVHYWPLPESAVLVDNYRNSVTYPVQVALVSGTGGSNLPADSWMRSREILLQLFPRKPLTAVPCVHTVTVVPGALYAEIESPLNVDLQSVIFQCVTELPHVGS